MIRGTLKLKGVRESIVRLRSTGVKLRTRALARSLKSATARMASATKTEAPRQTGTLARAQIVKVKGYRRGSFQLAVVGARSRKYANGKNPAKYSHLVHNGHKIANGKKVLRSGPWKGGTHRIRRFSGKVAGNPFALRGFRNSSTLVQFLFSRSIGQEIERAAGSF